MFNKHGWSLQPADPFVKEDLLQYGFFSEEIQRALDVFVPVTEA
jgi:hypothetical protein